MKVTLVFTANDAHVTVSANVGVPADNVTFPVVFPLYVSVPVPLIFKSNAVYVPLLDNVILFIFNVLAVVVKDVVPKSNELK